MLRGRRRMLRGRRMPPRRRRMPGGVAATVKLCIKITARAWVGGGWSKTQRVHYVGDARLLPRSAAHINDTLQCRRVHTISRYVNFLNP